MWDYDVEQGLKACDDPLPLSLSPPLSPPSLSLSLSLSLSPAIYVYRTSVHTYVDIYIYICTGVLEYRTMVLVILEALTVPICTKPKG